MTLRFVQRLRTYDDCFEPGDRIDSRHITQDDLNFYVHGWANEPVPGIRSSYLTVPRYYAIEDVPSGSPGRVR